MVSVQDEASQLVSVLLDLQEGDSLLDLCSAPGGKLASCLESGPALSRVVAIESDSKRLLKLKDTLARLSFNDITLHCSDATNIDKWWDGETFDRIMLDAPCSATGVIRRQPDIKILRKPEDITRLNLLQLRLLRTAWELLSPGGRLVYSTCSILPAENSGLIGQFLQEYPEAQTVPILLKPDNAIASTHGLQLLPYPQGSDGFYYMVLEKPDSTL
jgi:16S rRNA (cytosine967-C5)-methyltransferase